MSSPSQERIQQIQNHETDFLLSATACTNNGNNGDDGYQTIPEHLSQTDDTNIHSNNDNGKANKEEPSFTYIQLLRDNTNYRYYWLSYVANHMGEWMTYLASISMIQNLTLSDDHNNTPSATTFEDSSSPSSSSSSSRVNTLISILILVKLLPNVIFMPLGGVLADKYDRRHVQIVLDVTSSVLVWVYLWAVWWDSVGLLYVANFVQESLSGLYVPSNSAMLPLLASSSDQELQKATTLSGVTWSLMAALGSSTGGLLVALFGVQGCFILDSLTYLVSAVLLLYGVKGSYLATNEDDTNIPHNKQQQRQRRRASSVSKTSTTGGSGNGGQEFLVASLELQTSFAEEDENDTDNPSMDQLPSPPQPRQQPKTQSELSMLMYGLRFAFLESPLVGAYALLKGAAATAYGATDVLNVSFSSRGSEDVPSTTSLKLGILFGCVGVGCIIGSTLCDLLVTLSRPLRIVRSCLGGYCLISLGCLLMAQFPDYFAWICVSGIIRSVGSSLIWINSTLLLQKYSPPVLLGRVRSIDVSAALFGEAFSALGGGLLMDNLDVSPERLSLLLSLVAVGCFLFWTPLLGFRTPKE